MENVYSVQAIVQANTDMPMNTSIASDSTRPANAAMPANTAMPMFLTSCESEMHI